MDSAQRDGGPASLCELFRQRLSLDQPNIHFQIKIHPETEREL